MVEQATQLVVLHPAALDGRAWGFGGGPTALVPTLPGHGRRARARAGLTLRDIADEIAGWTVGRLDIVGFSLGGMVAQHFALAHPERVRSLVLACTTARTDPAVLQARAEATTADPRARTIEITMRRWFSPETLAIRPSPEPVEYARRCLEAVDLPSLGQIWRAIGEHDLSVELSAVRAPTTCIAGRLDVSSPPAEVEDIAERLPNARLRYLDAAHMALLEQPAACSALVREHIAWAEELQ